uniref:NADH-ubiquinone oxidoreductase chain 4 n=3 Tax=Vespa velutina TaxID=202808 RepID=A0A347YEJ8_VESVE|nr:NADH dehydrogenase subunit 4 [Vespa velutina]AQT19235.1 NADH dehydrogenase subunit 4 [Vespa velutina nigrithorax]QKG04149.1 NADH dehydrogenase subunit 4 [Vespa velutina auraria]BAX73958.1 NADH dehydrogenase subunit 4 [Vespa velutina]BBC27616.1 NADH dehydrogenase subunit 4 [Vespa velutina]BBC27629.1 NADH dehydrogenase subunit 4 [Vespa velutina]
MMKLILSLVFSIGLFNFKFVKFSKSIIMFYFSSYMLIMLLYYSSNMWVGGYMFFFDYYSYMLVILSLWISGCMLMINMTKLMEFMILILMILLMLCFFSLNLLMFYLMFEVSLLPIFFLILYGGYSYERYESIMYMLMYTVVSSMPFLWLLLLLYVNYWSLMILLLIFLNLSLDGVMFFLCLLGFMVKLPMFLFHIWLPKAHVEAPVFGSMILAGVLLKLGSYGMLRMMQIFYLNIVSYSYIIITLGLVGGILMSLMCLIQVDMKMLVAYSSIVHMSLLVSGMVTMTKIGMVGGLMMMLAHGLCSSGLFYIVNINYECFGSRLIYLNKGSMSIYPSLGLFWFLMCSSNLSAPISLNLISEIFLLISLMSWSTSVILLLMIMCFLSAAYSLYLFSMSQHGESQVLQMKYKNVFVMDYFMLIMHWVPLNFMFLSLSMFML